MADLTPEVQDLPGTIVPVPMSFPAILRNPKLADRYAHLREGSKDDSQLQSSISYRKKTREDHEGKRWVRRKENARFSGNPHIVHASGRDADAAIELPAARMKHTFPEPLPHYLPRSVAAPSAPLRPAFDPSSANLGRFSLSLKGMRRDLRCHGPRVQNLVCDVEQEITEWLADGVFILPNDALSEEGLPAEGRSISGDCVTELLRTPLKMIWDINHDALARYVVHCCARYHKVVSYSKDINGRRLTFLLRPNTARPDHTSRLALQTPPVTESDFALGVLSESDLISVDENESATDVESVVDDPADNSLPRQNAVPLEEIEELAEEGTTRMHHHTDHLSAIEDNASYGDADDDVSEIDAVQNGIDILDINTAPEADAPEHTVPPLERARFRDRRRANRALSSPSRSPCSPIRVGRRKRIVGRRLLLEPKKSFYEYLYT